MLIIGHRDVERVLDGAEDAVLAAVRHAYLRHEAGDSALPHSVFLRFPDNPHDRIIGLPGYLGGGEGRRPVAGLKWIASFPGNVPEGLPRASATMILNSLLTGRPLAVLESATISARRTAASAALAAAALPGTPQDTGVSLIGCGVINAETLHFLRVTLPKLAEVTVFDLDRERAEAFAARCARRYGPALTVRVADRVESALGAHRLVSVATTAAVPHLDLAPCRPGTLVLHLSLRDVRVPAVLAADNVVDDPDHVCRAATSLHLAEQRVGHREFIRATVGALLRAPDPAPRAAERLTVFSPFGLGVLDLAVADLVLTGAQRAGLGVSVPDFLPDPEAEEEPY
ncbi:ornithine cyclodeaminase [Streptomyces zhaozhouensis]|uniref:Ornithine cyclodeaminase n=1 Tax=Streptomyces zhaozhouensis TaxID=1300267 RepID=A0A286DZV6_9ACTN|nr:2,3-diaminopropionate biosynthesis protein SbnB [Streptomyces zhaozhouensis]SOD64134.1 ornithine cyclodeaminase [Streptomyces zhaozhouensis]